MFGFDLYSFGIVITGGLLFSIWITFVSILLFYEIKEYITDSTFKKPNWLNIIPFIDEDGCVLAFNTIIYFLLIIGFTIIWPLTWFVLIVYVTLRILRFLYRIKTKYQNNGKQ